jgi:hypothetical protein
MGFAWRHELPDWSHYSNSGPPSRYFHLGKEIEVSKLWDIIKHERSRPKEVAGAINSLRALADLLENVNKALPTPPADSPPEG